MKIKPEDKHVNPSILFTRAQARMTLKMIEAAEEEGFTNDEIVFVMSELITSLIGSRVFKEKVFKAGGN